MYMVQQVNKLGKSDWYMAWYQDDEVLMNSSSGGAFTAIAEVVLQDNGVVFGATFDEKTWDVYHKPVTCIEELNDIRGSKYYQSQAFLAYADCKKYLDAGIEVLFSGTACQVAALKNYLGKSYDNLITVDVLCHGVTSKSVVKKYATAEERKAKQPIKSIAFRPKGLIPWRNGCGASMLLNYTDGTQKVITDGIDSFFLAFSGNLILRPSCYECHFTGTDRISDFTLSDYWGVDDTCASEYNLEKGISVLVVNTDKARDLLNRVSKDFIYGLIDPMERAVPCNLAFTKPPPRNEKKASFFAEYQSTDYDRLIHKLYRPYLIKRCVKQGVKMVVGPKGVAMIKSTFKKLTGGDRESAFSVRISQSACYVFPAYSDSSQLGYLGEAAA